MGIVVLLGLCTQLSRLFFPSSSFRCVAHFFMRQSDVSEELEKLLEEEAAAVAAVDGDGGP